MTFAETHGKTFPLLPVDMESYHQSLIALSSMTAVSVPAGSRYVAGTGQTLYTAFATTESTTPTSESFQLVRWRSRLLKLRHAIKCEAYQEGEYYVVEYLPLGIISYSKSAEGARRDFQEEFVVIWEDYALASDKALSPSGRRLKRALRKIVHSESVVDGD